MASPSHADPAHRAPARKPVVREIREKVLPERKPPSEADYAFVLKRVPDKKAKKTSL